MTLLPFNMKIYKKLWDQNLINHSVFDRNGKYKNGKICITDKYCDELILEVDDEKYALPLEVKMVQNTIPDIKSAFYKFQIDFCLLYQKSPKSMPLYNNITFLEWDRIFGISKKLAKLNDTVHV